MSIELNYPKRDQRMGVGHNWRAEQAIRPAVVNRKVFGGNRTLAGAEALGILASIFATCRQHGRDALDYLAQLLRLPPDSDPVADPLPLSA